MDATDRLPSQVKALIVARAVNQLGGFSLAFLTVLLTRSFGTSLTTAGIVSAAFGLATIPSRLAGGRLADHWGRRRTIVAGLVALAVAQLGLAAAPDLITATICAVAMGLAFELFEPPSQATIADAVPPARRASAFELLTTAVAAGSLAAGVIADIVGRWSLRWLFVVDAGTGLACAAIVALALAPDAVRKPEHGAESDQPATSAISPWRDPALLIATVSGTVFALVSMLMLSALPLALGAVGLNPASAGLIMAASTGTLVLARPVLRRRWLAELPHSATFVLGYLLMAAGLCGYAVAHTLPALLVPTALYSLGNLLVLGRSFAVVSELAPASASARYLAVYGLSWGVATLLAPLVGTWLIGVSGAGLLWGVSAGVCGVMAVAQPWVVRRVRDSQRDLGVIHSTKAAVDRYDAVSI
ncbi:major facilitator superfamily MFS_1 [Catenulispora acidiphila DSM 44928]|uniref:Major facilitator superfamily MFS_1 n=1 Tax=Catenulispora acidiphila (strain DSM 44928 / JCM 14897 / NBRC 102108 / NRRL B-24433 / ID139908) TaxID=479433 RepID=C7QJ02_CATAD|nr:major facilitator superfamily MFS_1 [Catenulispora acidiphila DSM 44928]